MKLIVTNTEQKIETLVRIFNMLSLVEIRYIKSENKSDKITEYFKHTIDDKWWVRRDDVVNNMGVKGKEVLMTFFPHIKTELFRIIEVADLVIEGYLPSQTI